MTIFKSEFLLGSSHIGLRACSPSHHFNYFLFEGHLSRCLVGRQGPLRCLDLALIIGGFWRLTAPGGTLVAFGHVLDLLVLCLVRVCHSCGLAIDVIVSICVIMVPVRIVRIHGVILVRRRSWKQQIVFTFQIVLFLLMLLVLVRCEFLWVLETLLIHCISFCCKMLLIRIMANSNLSFIWTSSYFTRLHSRRV